MVVVVIRKRKDRNRPFVWVQNDSVGQSDYDCELLLFHLFAKIYIKMVSLWFSVVALYRLKERTHEWTNEQEQLQSDRESQFWRWIGGLFAGLNCVKCLKGHFCFPTFFHRRRLLRNRNLSRAKFTLQKRCDKSIDQVKQQLLVVEVDGIGSLVRHHRQCVAIANILE